MATWPDNPSWVNPNNNINGGNKYASVDGVTASDLNNIIKDLIYLKNVPTPAVQASKAVTIVQNGAITITPDVGYGSLAQCVIIVNVPTSTGNMPTLYAPTISINGNILTITNSPNNGAFVTNYVLYANGILLDNNVTTTTLNLTNYSSQLTLGNTYSITVKAMGTYFNESNASNAINWTGGPRITVTWSITNGRINGIVSGSAYIDQYGTSTLTITADTGYLLPSSITVTGVAPTVCSYNSANGIITITDPGSSFTISAACVLYTWDITYECYTTDASPVHLDTVVVTVSGGTYGSNAPPYIATSGFTLSMIRSTPLDITDIKDDPVTDTYTTVYAYYTQNLTAPTIELEN